VKPIPDKTACPGKTSDKTMRLYLVSALNTKFHYTILILWLYTPQKRGS